MMEDQEPISYLNVTIKEEIELPDVNLDENGEVEISVIKIESFEENTNETEELSQFSLEAKDVKDSESNRNFFMLNHNADFKDTASIQKNKLSLKKPRRPKAAKSQDENCTSQGNKCDKCQKVFTRKDRLRVHSKIHSGQKPHTCSECHKSFLELSNLKRHLRIHSGEKPYKCNDCQKEFSLKCNLLTHSRIHSGEKPYECEMCQKKFPHTSDLKKHLRTHSNEKPFKCAICGKSFQRRYRLKDHLQIHSKENQIDKKETEKSLM